MKDPLLPVGTVVLLLNDNFQRSLEKILIIGKRGIKENIAYDYIGVNLYDGYIQANEENSLLFFNSTEIQEISSTEPEPSEPEESGSEENEGSGEP